MDNAIRLVDVSDGNLGLGTFAINDPPTALVVALDRNVSALYGLEVEGT